MAKGSTKDSDIVKDGIFIRLDTITVDRLRTQAARKHGTTKGYIQDYVRAALMHSLEMDESTMKISEEAA